jgi:iron complex transport system substrate-binding protein
MAPDVERIAVLRPSLVFVALPIHRQVVEKLRELGVRCRVSDPQTVEAVLAEVESAAALLGVPERGAALAASLRRRLDSLPAGPDTPLVYVEISAAPLMSVGGGTFVSDLVARAGGRNVFSGCAEPYPVVDPERVAAGRPDVILLLHPGTSAAEVRARLGWSRIPAVKSGRIIGDIDDDLLLRPGPRMVEGVVQLRQRLHPADR